MRGCVCDLLRDEVGAEEGAGSERMQTQLLWPYLPVYDKVEIIGKHIMIWRGGDG